MRILILSQFFPPEIGATQTRVHSFASGLAELGHTVEVICEVPNHPQGVIHESYRHRPFVRRHDPDGFDVTHVWVYTAPQKTTTKRLAFYGTYTALATAVGAIRSRPDVIIASSPPLPVALAGDLIAARHRAPWVMDVRDLWPAAAVGMGEMSEGRALRLAEALEARLYKRATAIIAVTEPFREKIARITNASKIHVIPNGTTQFWLDAASIDPDRSELNLPKDQFIWTFAGNIGAAQGLEAAIDAAGLLGDGFRLLIVGDGPARGELERLSAKSRGNIEFRGQVSLERARELLRASDALLVSLAADPIFEDFVPSKLFDYCATGRPTIVAAAGEASRIAETNAAALAVPPGDASALAAAIRTANTDPIMRTRLGANGHALAVDSLRDTQHTRLASLLEHVYS